MLQDSLPTSTRQKLYTPDRLLDDSADICLTFLHVLRYTISIAQHYDNLGKSLWTDHATDLSRFVLGEECVDVTRATPVDQQTQADLLYGISVFGGIVYNAELFERLIPEELMQESKTYQRQMERAARETTIENTLALLSDQFQPETVSALTPALRSVNDLQKLKQLLRAAARVQDIEAFAQMLYE